MANEINTPPTPEEAESKRCFTLCNTAALEFMRISQAHCDQEARIKVAGNLLGNLTDKLEQKDFELSEMRKKLAELEGTANEDDKS